MLKYRFYTIGKLPQEREVPEFQTKICLSLSNAVLSDMHLGKRWGKSSCLKLQFVWVSVEKKLNCGLEAKMLQRKWKRWKVKFLFAWVSTEIKLFAWASVTLMSKSFLSLRKSNIKHHAWKLTKATLSSTSQSLWTSRMGCVWSEWKIKDLWFRRSTF